MIRMFDSYYTDGQGYSMDDGTQKFWFWKKKNMCSSLRKYSDITSIS